MGLKLSKPVNVGAALRAWAEALLLPGREAAAVAASRQLFRYMQSSSLLMVLLEEDYQASYESDAQQQVIGDEGAQGGAGWRRHAGRGAGPAG